VPVPVLQIITLRHVLLVIYKQLAVSLIRLIPLQLSTINRNNYQSSRLSLFFQCELHKSDHWCFKCQRKDKRKSVCHNQMTTELPCLSTNKAFLSYNIWINDCLQTSKLSQYSPKSTQPSIPPEWINQQYILFVNIKPFLPYIIQITNDMQHTGWHWPRGKRGEGRQLPLKPEKNLACHEIFFLSKIFLPQIQNLGRSDNLPFRKNLGTNLKLWALCRKFSAAY